MKQKSFQDVFQRYEKKYLLTPQQYKDLAFLIKDRIEQDTYGSYTICNLYLDTEDYQLIRNSIEKPAYKEKIRLRSYGIAKNDSTVFLELKKKYQNVVYKRRIPLTCSDAMNYLNFGIPPEDSQIFREIDWSMKFYKPVPKVFIGYDRTAFFEKENPELRITFDTKIRFRDHHLNLTAGEEGNPILNANDILMEIKIPGIFPLWLSHALSECSIFPVSFSKYGVCYKNFICHSQQHFDAYSQSGGINCA